LTPDSVLDFDDYTSLSDFFHRDDAFIDLDMFFVSDFDVNTPFFSSLFSFDVSLCSRFVHSRLSVEKRCCVVDSPVYVYVRDSEKVALANTLEQRSSHCFLPVSNKTNVFLSTPRGRRVSGNTFTHCLLLAGIRTVAMEHYGMKSFCFTYADFFASVPAECCFNCDFGLQKSVCANGFVPLIGVKDRVNIGGIMMVRPMFTDYVVAELGRVKCGSVEWVPLSVVRIDDYTIVRVKLYPVYIHWVKAFFPESTHDVPYSYKTLRLRMSQLSRLVARLAACPDDVSRKLTLLRVEVTVGGRGRIDYGHLTRDVLPSWFLTLSEKLFVFDMPVQVLVERGREWLDRAKYCSLYTGRNEASLPSRKVKHVCQILNEFGIATDAVVRRLENRDRNGRYPWELNIAPPAAPFSNRYPVARATAPNSNHAVTYQSYIEIYTLIMVEFNEIVCTGSFFIPIIMKYLFLCHTALATFLFTSTKRHRRLIGGGNGDG
jgi:hypothetical protein